jgi:hypothetical protein
MAYVYQLNYQHMSSVTSGTSLTQLRGGENEKPKAMEIGKGIRTLNQLFPLWSMLQALLQIIRQLLAIELLAHCLDGSG